MHPNAPATQDPATHAPATDADLVAVVDAVLDAHPDVTRRYLVAFPELGSGGQAWIAHGLADRIAAASAPDVLEPPAVGVEPVAVDPDGAVDLGDIDKALLLSAFDAIGADRELTAEQVEVLEAFADLDGVDLELFDDD